MDIISLHDLEVQTNVGLDCWRRSRSQPVRLTVHLHTDISRAGDSDRVEDTIDYSQLGKDAFDFIGAHEPFDSLYHLAVDIAQLVLSTRSACFAVRIHASVPKQILCSDGLFVDVYRRRVAEGSDDLLDSIVIRNLHIPIIIGVNDGERQRKQRVTTTITFQLANTVPNPDYNSIAVDVTKVIEASCYLTLEAFAVGILRHIFRSLPLDSPITSITVQAEKPSAVLSGQSSGVQIQRNRSWFHATDHEMPSM